MEKKRLTKTMWYGSDVDHAGNAILPEAAASDNHLSGLNEGEIYIHNHPDNPSIWTRTTDGKIVSISGVDISVLEKLFLSKTKDDRSKGKIASDKAIEVGNYVSGASGAIIYKDAENGQTVAEFDKLYVRMKAYFETLEIINVNTIGGKQIISPAGSVRCIGVEETDNAYRCYFLAEQDGEKVQNRFLVNDQIYSQMFDAVEGTSQNVSTHYFWRLCIAKSKEPVTFENKSCHYIDLSKTDCDKDSDVPMVGDVLNQRGNRTDLDRMNFIEMSSVDAFSPNITLFHGVNSYSLDGKAYVSYGVDKSTNKAFMNVYGDMYVGDRQNTSYMRYTQENGLEISGTLSIGTKLGDTPLKDLISASSPEGYQEFVEKVTQDIEGLQAQIDGAIESYFFQYDPTLGNYPASEWITEEQKKAHLNDTFTNLISGYSWRWTIDNGVYGWTEITDTATSKALALAGQAKDTADGKRRVFVEQPKPDYDKGDLWSRGSEYPLMICINGKSKAKGEVYEASDWDYADNNAKLKEEMQELVGDTKDELNNAIGQAKNEAVNNAKAYTDEGKKALQASIDAMESTKANLDDVYTRAQADGKISESEINAINAAKAQADAAIALSEITIKAYADGIVDEEEAARIKQAKENLDAAKKYAEEQAQKAIDEANDTYGYLAKALGTEVDGGLLLTSLIQMRDTDQNIMSGINGLTAKGDKSIATWWGGGMYDMFEYYDWDGAKWVAKKNIQIPSNVPSGVIRMDGTGYLAKGKFWWDESGKIYADPTALFLMFDVEDESASLSQTILAMRDKQTEFADMWEFKTDANGKKYLYSTFDLVTQGGVSMYNSGNSDIPSGGGGGSIDYPLSWSGFSSGSFDGSAAKTIYIPSKLSELTNDSGYALSSALSGYLPKSGGELNGSLTIASDKNNATNKLRIGSSSNTYYGGEYVWVDLNVNGSLKSNLVMTESKLCFKNNIVFHAGNFNPSDYLPITGGNIARNNVTLLSLNNTGESSIVESGVRYEIKGAAKAWIGYNSSLGAILYNYAKKSHLGIKDDGSLSYSGGTIFHSGNFNPSDYLPKSGGTITGTGTDVLHINSTYGNVNDNGTYITLQHKGVKTAEFGHGWGVGTYIKANKYTLRIDNDGIGYVTNNVILHAGNYSSYALPLTGGTLTQTENKTSLLFKNTNYDPYISFQKGAAVLGHIVVNSSGVLQYHPQSETTYHTVIHSGNIGSQSVASAEVISKVYTNENINNYSRTEKKLRLISCTFSNASDAVNNGYPNISYLSGISVLTNYTGWQMLSYGAPAEKPNPYYRAVSDKGVWTDWNQLAFLTDNVASATKLQTSRSIWGQSFNGTGNVSGDIYNFDGLNFKNGNQLYGYSDGSFGINITSTKNAVKVLTSGDVGIGTTSPTTKLDVHGALKIFDYIDIREPNTKNRVTAYAYSGIGRLYSYNDDNGYNDLYLGQNSTNAIVVKANGNVGIGTGSPAYKLDVSTNSSDYIAARFTNTSYHSGILINSKTGYNPYILFQMNNSGVAEIGRSYGKNTLYLGASGTDVGYLNILLSNGNVGIGTTNPSARLDVKGVIATTNYIRFDGSSTEIGYIGRASSDDDMYFNSLSDLYINAHGDTYINATGGNVGIGTTNPASKLDVNGNAEIDGNIYLYGELALNAGYSIQSYNSTPLSINRQGNNIYLCESGYGNVSIGTAESNYKLQVAGDLGVNSSINLYSGDQINGKSGIAFNYNLGKYVNVSIYDGNAGRIAHFVTGGITFDKSLSIYSSLYVDSTSTFTGKTTHNGGLESTVASAYAIYGNSSTSRVCIAGDNGKSLYIASKGNSADYYLVSVNYGQTTLGSGGSNAFTIRGDGNVGIGQNAPSAKLHVAGNILTSGSITMNSMRSMKNIINENGLSLEELSTIKPTRFTWKDGRDDRIHVGGIADDVMKVLPEVVFKGNDGVLSMDYASAAFVMAASLIQPMTEHERRIANLERENALLKEEIRNLKSA